MDIGDIDRAKRSLRKLLRARLAEHAETELADLSELACANLMASEAFRHAHCLMLYMPLRSEVDLVHAMLRCFQDNQVVCVPRVDWDHKRMIPIQIHSFDDRNLVNDRYGLRMPDNGVPIPVEMLELVVVPGLGFDVSGNRIGRGAGYYDRFLAQPGFCGRTIGLGFDFQMVDSVPRLEHDMRLDSIVTDRRVTQADPSLRRPPQ